MQKVNKNLLSYVQTRYDSEVIIFDYVMHTFTVVGLVINPEQYYVLLCFCVCNVILGFLSKPPPRPLYTAGTRVKLCLQCKIPRTVFYLLSNVVFPRIIVIIVVGGLWGGGGLQEIIANHLYTRTHKMFKQFDMCSSIV